MARTRGERGLGSKSHALLAAALPIIEELQPLTIRGLCYQLFVRGHLASMAKKETQKVSRLLVTAREQRLVDWDAIVDESRRAERAPSFRNLSALADAIQHSYRRDYWTTQPYHLQVWSEKATVGGVIRPVTEKYGVSFMAVHGFGSATVVNDAAQMSAEDERETIILYVGDHDPSGRYMADVDLPQRLEKYGGAIDVEIVSLLAEDLPGLPSFPAKTTDSRYRWYRQHYGNEAWELDAQDPNVLRDRVEDAIVSYIDDAAWERMELVEAAEQKTVATITKQLR